MPITGYVSHCLALSVPYRAGAVSLDVNTWLQCNSLSAADNASVSFSGWFKYSIGGGADPNGFPCIYVVDPQSLYLSYMFINEPSDFFLVMVSGTNSTENTTYKFDSPNDNVWHHIMGTATISGGMGFNTSLLYVDRIKLVATSSSDTTTSSIARFNNLAFWIGSDSFSGDKYIGDMADLRIMPGTFLADGGGNIPSATLDLFVTSGLKPVSPDVATAALGVPPMLFSGDAGSFGVNKGNAGSFITNGTLINATTSPSD